ncbi:hypothetical protein [Halocatena salina]|uniref:Uncharacterized protein n=1 Tax=Halocatena salina TaxID=2934340 RepID=A0A8U0A044_9EURY|nr:hypothetical protein [Halocatena salina]UPM42196.1 hypothetical protein MW046_09515 [Halocatena salina]
MISLTPNGMGLPDAEIGFVVGNLFSQSERDLAGIEEAACGLCCQTHGVWLLPRTQAS